MLDDFKKEFENPKTFFKNLFNHHIFHYSGYAVLAAIALFGCQVCMDLSHAGENSTVICFLHSLIYFTLAVCHVPILYRGGHLWSSLKNNWWKFGLVTILNFEGSFILSLSSYLTNYVIYQVLILIIVYRLSFFSFRHFILYNYPQKTIWYIPLYWNYSCNSRSYNANIYRY